MSRVGEAVQARSAYLEDQKDNTGMLRATVTTRFDAAEITLLRILGDNLKLSRAATVRMLVRTGLHDAFEALNVRAVPDRDERKVRFYTLAAQDEPEEPEPPIATIDLDGVGDGEGRDHR